MPVLLGSSGQPDMSVTEMKMEVRRGHVDAAGLDGLAVAGM
jgi:hypothetical protein